MSKETLELSAEEKAIIIAKREEEKANGLLRQKEYERLKNQAKVYAQARLDASVEKNEISVKAYHYFRDQLIAINPNFKLEKREIEFSQVVESLKLEYIDDEGNEIWQDLDGNCIPSHVQKECHETLTAKGYSCHIHYTGELPKGCLYGVKVDYHETGKTYTKKGSYKMQVQGTNFDFNEQRRHYISPKTVVDKILERIKWDFVKIENEKKLNSLKERALALAIEKYPNSEVSLSEKSYVRNSDLTYDVVKVKFANGIYVYLTFGEIENTIKFTLNDVIGLTGKDVDVVIGGLSKIIF
jgi:hypothetical protein